MPDTWKAQKVSSTLTSTGIKPQATLATSRVLKEKPTSRAQIHPSATKKHSRIALLHGAKDADTLALLEKIALQQGLSINLFFFWSAII